MEYFIGQEIEIIHYNKWIKLKIEEDNSNSCKNCFFHNDYDECIRDHFSNMEDAFCSSTARNDGNNIIFKQIK